MAKQGVFKGVAPGRFDPAGHVTRAQFAALMTRLFHLAAPTAPISFVDVPSGAWYYADVEAASPYMSEFTVPAGLAFEPSLDVTRIEVAATIGQIEVATGKETLPSASAAAAMWAGFHDGALVPSGLAQDAAVTVTLGLMKGLPGAVFGVQSRINRAQAAVLLARVLSSSETMPTVTGSVYGSGASGSSTAILPTGAVTKKVALPAGLSAVKLGAAWQQGAASVTVVAPDGTVYGPSSAKYVNLPVEHAAFYSLTAPAAGVWEIEVQGGPQIGTVTPVDLAPLAAPTITVTATGDTNGAVNVSWSSSTYNGQGHVSLYYNTTDNTANGSEFASGLPVGNGQSYQWMVPSTVAAGTYYVYAVVTDASLQSASGLAATAVVVP